VCSTVPELGASRRLRSCVASKLNKRGIHLTQLTLSIVVRHPGGRSVRRVIDWYDSGEVVSPCCTRRKKRLPLLLRFSSVEAESELIQAVRQVLVADGALMGSQEPAFQQCGDSMHARQPVIVRGNPPYSQTLHIVSG
jgi:hypothetical protein